MTQQDFIKIAILRPGNVLHIMTFMTRIITQGIDGNDIVIDNPPTTENIEAEITRNGEPFIEWKIIDVADIPTDRTYRDAWTLQNGNIVVDNTRATNIAMANLREKRNNLLEESDAYVLPDRWNTYTTEQQTAWSTYRQALRDFPTTVIDVFAPVWPTKPSI